MEVVLLEIGLDLLAAQLGHRLASLQQLPHLCRVSCVVSAHQREQRQHGRRRALVDEKARVSLDTM